VIRQKCLLYRLFPLPFSIFIICFSKPENVLLQSYNNTYNMYTLAWKLLSIFRMFRFTTLIIIIRYQWYHRLFVYYSDRYNNIIKVLPIGFTLLLQQVHRYREWSSDHRRRNRSKLTPNNNIFYSPTDLLN